MASKNRGQHAFHYVVRYARPIYIQAYKSREGDYALTFAGRERTT